MLVLCPLSVSGVHCRLCRPVPLFFFSGDALCPAVFSATKATAGRSLLSFSLPLYLYPLQDRIGGAPRGRDSGMHPCTRCVGAAAAARRDHTTCHGMAVQVMHPPDRPAALPVLARADACRYTRHTRWAAAVSRPRHRRHMASPATEQYRKHTTTAAVGVCVLSRVINCGGVLD